jgi:hypothetical protein
MSYIPKHFKIEELVSPDICDPSNPNQWFLFDERILITADRLRERYGVMYCNTWMWGGQHTFRGFRTWATKVGSANSQHKLGRALDLIPMCVDVDKVRNDIIANPTREEFEYIMAIELGVPWLHIDCRNYSKARNGLLQFGKPVNGTRTSHTV